MSLYGALFSGVSGLSSQSSAMGAISDNVVNVNTVGYKRTDVQFQTLITKQVALTKYSPGGVQSKPKAAIDTQGLLQATTSSTDVAISGQGFFIVNEAANPSSGDIFAYTRAGNFKVDKEGYLQNTSGWYIEGWPLQTWDNSTQASTVKVGNDTYMKSYKNTSGDTVYINDNIVDKTNLKPINLNTIGGTATATTTISMGLNLPSSDATGATHKTDVQFFDTLGNAHNITHTWAKRASNSWDVTAVPPKGSKTLMIEDQLSTRQNYYAAGRLDFSTIPDTGTSMTVTVDKTDYTVTFSTADDSSVLEQTLTMAATPTDAETFTANIDGTTTTFEWDDNNSVTSGNVALTIGADSTANASNLASAINTQLKSSLGETTWATASGTIVTFKPTNNNRVSFSDPTGTPNVTVANTSQTLTFGAVPADGSTLTMKVGGTIKTIAFKAGGGTVTGADTVINTTTSNTVTLVATAVSSYIDTQLDTLIGAAVNSTSAAGVVTVARQPGEVSFVNGLATSTNLTGTTLVDTGLTINTGNRSLSQVMDELATRVQNVMHYEYGGISSSPPNTWATRLSGENSIYMIQGSSTNAITVNALAAKTNGVAAAEQSASYSIEALDSAVAWTNSSNYAVGFNGDGTPDKFFGSDESSSTSSSYQYKVTWANGATDQTISGSIGNYNSTDGMTQFAGSYQINYISQNGASFGNFAGVSVAEDGIVTALFDNGVTKPVFMIPVATLTNPNGMEGRSGNVWIQTDTSGNPTVREAGNGGAGSMSSASLEASTVDIGEEFTNMIITQRAYSASTKIISTADDMLSELMRIKR